MDQLLLQLGIGVTSNAIYDFLKAVGAVSKEVLREKLINFLGVQNEKEKADELIKFLIENKITVVDGEHIARGTGNVTAIKAQKSVFFKPGTKSIAEGDGNITATHIC